MKKRIAMMVPTLSNGGAEKVASDLSIYFSRLGFEVYFFVGPYDKRSLFPHCGKIVTVREINPGNNVILPLQLWGYWKNAQKIKQLKKHYKIEITISFMLWDNFINMLSFAGDKRILTVHCVVSKMNEYRNAVFINRWLMKYLYLHANRVVTVSDYVKLDIERYLRVKSDQFCTIYNSVDREKILRLAKEEVDIPISKKTFLFVGRLDDDKRPWILIKVFYEVIRKIPDVKLVILGRGKNGFELKRFIRKLGLGDNIIFGGFRDNIYKYMIRSRAVIICSKAEAFPCAIIEALAVGTPVIANDCPGGIRELLLNSREVNIEPNDDIIIGECGVLTPMILSRDDTKYDEVLCSAEKKMVEAIERIVIDDELHKRLSLSALKKSDCFDYKEIVKCWKSILEQ